MKYIICQNCVRPVHFLSNSDGQDNFVFRNAVVGWLKILLRLKEFTYFFNIKRVLNSSKQLLMKLQIICLFLLLISVTMNAQKSAQYKSNQTNKKAKRELEAAEAKMFESIIKYDNNYFRNYVSDDYITINADGTMANKAQTMADSARRQMFQGITTKLFDKVVRVYGNAGIINGRAQFLFNNTMVAEVYYTEIWKKQRGKWMFAGWQGTYTKDSPKLPGS